MFVRVLWEVSVCEGPVEGSVCEGSVGGQCL